MPITIKKNKKYYIDRLSELKGEYDANGWQENHEEKTKYLYPHGRNLDDSKKDNDGTRKDEYILNNTALTSILILVSGLFSGITPAHEPWFKLRDEDDDINEIAAVADYYFRVTRIILDDMGKSNFYSAMELMYKDMVTYAISSIQVDEDPDTIFHFNHIPNGQYYVDSNSKGEISALYRVFRMRARNLLAEYGEENLSDKVLAALQAPKTGGEYFTILHAIERNDARDVTKEDNLNMEWKSVTYEHAGTDDDAKPLRESGYRTQPWASPRWSVSSGNLYGHGPGDVAIGDAKQLQKYVELLTTAIEKEIKAPLVSYADVDINTGPDEITYIDDTNPTNQKALEPLYRVTMDINKMVAAIVTLQQRIETAFHTDLFVAFSGRDEGQKTATESIIIERELLKILGPITQRMTPEALQKFIMRCFDIENRLGRLPEPPPDIVGRPIKIEIVSKIAQAQELNIITPIEQLMNTVISSAEAYPEALDKIDIHQTIDEIARVLNIPPGIIRPDEVIAEITAIKAQQALEEQQTIEAQESIAGAKELSQTDLSTDNALTALMGGGAV